MNPNTRPSLAGLLPEVVALAEAAGVDIMAIYNAGPTAVMHKVDDSPLTAADLAAHGRIVVGLQQLTPDIPVVSEEGCVPDEGARAAPVFWLVDPLDGTKEFVARNGEFTVNIALVQDGAPVLGVVYAPALERLFAGVVGQGAWVEDAVGRRPIGVRAVPAEGLTVVASRSHGDAAALDAFLAGRKVARLANAGSSLKLCLVAAGEADIYPRLGRTMEWDIAAGHAVLSAAGGRVSRLDGVVLGYGKPGFDNPHFVASGASACARAAPSRTSCTRWPANCSTLTLAGNCQLRASPT